VLNPLPRAVPQRGLTGSREALGWRTRCLTAQSVARTTMCSLRAVLLRSESRGRHMADGSWYSERSAMPLWPRSQNESELIAKRRANRVHSSASLTLAEQTLWHVWLRMEFPWIGLSGRSMSASATPSTRPRRATTARCAARCFRQSHIHRCVIRWTCEASSGGGRSRSPLRVCSTRSVRRCGSLPTTSARRICTIATPRRPSTWRCCAARWR